MNKQREPGKLVLLVALVLALSGCGPDPLVQGVMELTPTNLHRVTYCYKAFHTRNAYAGPKDETELKSFMVSDRGKESLRLLGVAPGELDSIFINERDGQPFKIRYGIEGSAFGVDQPLVFEAVGANGIRKVAFGNGLIKEASGKEYDDWLAGKYSADKDTVSAGGAEVQLHQPPGD